MQLNIEALENSAPWNAAGVRLPAFNHGEMMRNTEESPAWVHFGAGNIFRGFIARLQQQLLIEGHVKSGIIAVETFDFDIIDKIYDPHDNLSLIVSLKPDGSTSKEVIASVAKAFRSDNPSHFIYLKKVFANPSLQMASLTITEKGYALTDIRGELLSVVDADMESGPEKARHTISLLTALLLHRYLHGAYPIALVSMDNFSGNGDKLKYSVFFVAETWVKRKFAEPGFLNYLTDPCRVRFPWSMIDKITPRPSDAVHKQLVEAGIEGMDPIITSKKTYIAPFVNTEAPQYLVIEDAFPNGRPPLERAGVYITDRAIVDKVERMKVTTCLNPLHTALAIFGCLLGYTSIAREMADPELAKLVRRIGYDEGLAVVPNPGIIGPEAFLAEVIEQRLPNPFIPDTPQRIATDTSQKIRIRFGETIKSYMLSDRLSASSLTFIPLTIAAWFRYLLGKDDNLNAMEVSDDPLLESLRGTLAGVKADDPESYKDQLSPILSNRLLFAVDLYEAGLGDRIEQMFLELLGGKGAVRKALSKYLGKQEKETL